MHSQLNTCPHGVAVECVLGARHSIHGLRSFSVVFSLVLEAWAGDKFVCAADALGGIPPDIGTVASDRDMGLP